MLHEGAREFARKYPAAAPMLLEQGGDPDAERILEGTAYLCAKIHERLDQTAPELIQTLLREVFPESVMPVPSMAVMRFALSPGFAEPLLVKRGAQLSFEAYRRRLVHLQHDAGYYSPAAHSRFGGERNAQRYVRQRDADSARRRAA